VRVACAGASAARAAVLARELVEAGIEALLSFGIAGALAPDLDCGALFVAEAVRGSDGRDYPCDGEWHRMLAARLSEVGVAPRDGTLLGTPRLLREAADKQAAHRDSGCLAVDMESGAVAAVAAEAGLPFLAVRAIADRAGDSLPAVVEHAVKPDGMPALARTIAALIRHPGQLPATLRLARQSAEALRRLRRLEAVKDALFGGF
jgi:hopanoid-associated phosphorylase